MSSVPKPTILDFIGHWLPRECSVCHSNGHEVKFAWLGDRIYCWMCAESASQEVRQRLHRVRAARQALGFENFERYDIQKALWPGVGRFDMAVDRRVPPVFGDAFTSPLLGKQHIGERYYIHGLSSCTPDQLNTLLNTLDDASLHYSFYPARPKVVELYRGWQRFWSRRDEDSESDREEEPSPLRSEVVVYIGGAIIPEAHPDNHYMWSWRPEAPWLGYKEGPHHTESLPVKELDSLFKAGRKLLDIHFRGPKEGSRKFQTTEDFEQAVVSAILALRAGKKRISKAAIGRHFGRTYSPQRPDDDRTLSDPGKNIKRWADEFGVDVNALISKHGH